MGKKGKGKEREGGRGHSGWGGGREGALICIEGEDRRGEDRRREEEELPPLERRSGYAPG